MVRRRIRALHRRYDRLGEMRLPVLLAMMGVPALVDVALFWAGVLPFLPGPFQPLTLAALLVTRVAYVEGWCRKRE